MTVPRVDFYLLQDAGAESKLQLACRLASKIYRIGKTVFVLAVDAEQARRLDELMWTFDQGSFLPHRRAEEQSGSLPEPVIIGHGQAPCESRQNVLISLVNEAPQHYVEYERVADIVAAGDDDKARARERFRFYRAQGCELETHDIRG